MMYVICDSEKAEKAHISTTAHKKKGPQVILNEKEVEVNTYLDGSLEQRAEALDGRVYTFEGAMQEINEGGWKYE